ncbi:ABC transporter permease [Bacillus paramycoides]|uniref:ABC transporter permease n=1 Tax=Bacillus paramycoides TaxID=2026194 RepID=UPI003CFC7CF6
MKKQHFLRMLKQNMNSWVAISLVGVAIVLLPNFFIVISLFQKVNENWQHIKDYMLRDYIWNTLQLAFFTGICTIIVGVTLAWLVAAYDFPLKKLFRWMFVLPLAIPPYIAAYTYSGMLSYTGVVQRFFRNTLEWKVDTSYFNIMSIQGAVFIFTITLFPYVYIITKSYLENQSASLIENARLLGKNQWQVFYQVVLPISQVAIVGGVSLVILEVLNDYGVASYFGIQTFSTAIFQTWFGMYDVDSAVRLAAILMVGVITFLFIEKLLRNRKKFNATTSKTKALTPIRLKGWKGLLALSYCVLIFSFSFAIPFIQMISWALLTYESVLQTQFIELIKNTLFVALLATTIIIVLSIMIANVCRVQKNSFSNVLTRFVSIGYSIPGAVLAIGVLTLFISVDKGLSTLYEWVGTDRKLVLSLSIVMVIFAYVIRYLAIGFNSIEAGFEKMGTKYYEASRMLGFGMTKTFIKVDLPLMKGTIISGFILTFVDIMKELPLTLILRPFNFDTLATKTYQFASDERIQEASISALIIVLISMVSVYIFYRLEKKEA